MLEGQSRALKMRIFTQFLLKKETKIALGVGVQRSMNVGQKKPKFTLTVTSTTKNSNPKLPNFIKIETRKLSAFWRFEH